MPKKQLVMVQEMPEDTPMLAYDDGQWLEEDIVGRNPSSTLEELADFCDGNAEARNGYDHVGCHRILAALLFNQVGRETSTRIMREIAEYGGLDGMVGVSGDTPAFKDFGIPDCWEEWELS